MKTQKVCFSIYLEQSVLDVAKTKASTEGISVSEVLTRADRPGSDRLGVEQHERLVSGRDSPRYRSNSDLDVEAYLRRQVSFPVRCPPRKDAGFAVNGAGICRLGDQPAAFLTGSVDNSAVSIFVLPRDSLNAFPDQERTLHRDSRLRIQDGQLAIVMGVIDRNAVMVVGPGDPNRLERVLSAYGTYPEP